MAFNPSVTSRTTLNTVSVEGATFNFPIFISTNQYFKERVKSYGSWTEVIQDPAIPSTSPSYAGLRLAFSQRPAPSRVYLGRRKADTLYLTPNPVLPNQDYGLTITVVNETDNTSVQTVVSITSDASPTVEKIVTALFTDMETTSPIDNITVINATDKLSVAADSGYSFHFSGLKKLVDTYVTTESAANVLSAIQDEDDDWYFIGTEDHSEAFILAMAAAVEPTGNTDKPKMYFSSTSTLNTLKDLPDPADDVIGKLKALNYLRTVCDWHDQADTLFPEMGDVAYNGPFQPGSTTWKFMRVAGVPAAANPATSKRLSTTMQGYIEDRNGNWVGRELGVDFYREGKTVSGEWIDVVRFSDWLNRTVKEELLNLLINQKGSKIPNTPAGRQLVANTVDGVLDRAVGFGALSGYIPTTVPSEEDISFFNKVNRILDNVKYVGYLSGAIHTMIIDGNLTYADETL